MPASIKEIVFPFLFLGAAACIAYSIFLSSKMIGDINEADGETDRHPFRFIFDRGFYLLNRHREACPQGGSTRAVFVLVLLAGSVFGMALCILWNY